jgi:hypothetical protein
MRAPEKKDHSVTHSPEEAWEGFGSPRDLERRFEQTHLSRSLGISEVSDDMAYAITAINNKERPPKPNCGFDHQSFCLFSDISCVTILHFSLINCGWLKKRMAGNFPGHYLSIPRRVVL